jgi:hypothetical protein
MQLPNDLVLEFDAYETIDRYGREYTANPIFLWTKDLKQGSNYVSEDGKTYRIEAKRLMSRPLWSFYEALLEATPDCLRMDDRLRASMCDRPIPN